MTAKPPSPRSTAPVKPPRPVEKRDSSEEIVGRLGLGQLAK